MPAQISIDKIKSRVQCLLLHGGKHVSSCTGPVHFQSVDLVYFCCWLAIECVVQSTGSKLHYPNLVVLQRHFHMHYAVYF